MTNPIEYAKSHPWIVGGVVFIIGLWWIMSRSASAPSDGGLGAAYYGAVAADRTAVTQQIIAQTNANAAVNLAQIQAGAYTGVQTKWADTQLAMTQSNNAAKTATAPYALASEYIGALSYVASQPGTVTTKSSSGFFGIGGGTKQTYTPNPNAAAASSALVNTDFFGYLAGH